LSLSYKPLFRDRAGFDKRSSRIRHAIEQAWGVPPVS